MYLLLFFFILQNSGVKRYVPGEIVVKFRDDIFVSEVQKLHIVKTLGAEIVYKSKFLNFWTIKLPDTSLINSVLLYLRNEEIVQFAHRNGIAKAFWIPNDPYFNFQWHFNQMHINMPNAWDINQGGSSSIKVAVLDDGFAYRYADVPSYEEDEVISSDGFYHIAPDLVNTNFTSGYDFVHDDPYPDPSGNHGTHVVGTIAQSTNNNLGVAGIAFNVTIIPVQVLGPGGTGSADQIADGVEFARQNGARIISMSLGGPPGDSTGFGIVHTAIKNAYQDGIVIIAAAGNAGVPELSYPAGYPECIAVAATEYGDELAPYSQYGEGIDISAPGGNTSVDKNGDGYPDGVLQNTCYTQNGKPVVDNFDYFFFQGTSMATPHVTGVSALILSVNPSFTNHDVANILYESAKDLGEPGYDTIFGWGRLDAYNALVLAQVYDTMKVSLWPGDTDNNGIADVRDVLPIGIYFGLTGPSRSDDGTVWKEVKVSPWSPRNASYADCDGNGVIEVNDILIIAQHFKKTHSDFSSLRIKQEDIIEYIDNFRIIYNSLKGENREVKEIKEFIGKIIDRYKEISFFFNKNRIFLNLKEQKHTQIFLFDVSGRKYILFSGKLNPGTYIFEVPLNKKILFVKCKIGKLKFSDKIIKVR